MRISRRGFGQSPLLLLLQRNNSSNYLEQEGIVSLVAYTMELAEELMRFFITTTFSVAIVMPTLKL
jgi:hypothetical protein